jgi:AcrR family transcriptional regulator
MDGPTSASLRGSAAQRARILDAARELFGTRGFEQVTMAEVAERAGVARATVFNHFPSRHALVEAITVDVLAYWDGMLERALADARTSTPTLVRALFDHMGMGIQGFHDFFRGVFREIMKIQVGLEEGGVADATRRRALERLTRLLARGQARGEITREIGAEDLARSFDALANGTIHHWLFDGTSGSLREWMGRAAEVYLGRVALAQTHGEPLPDLSLARDIATPAPERALPRSARGAARRTRR